MFFCWIWASRCGDIEIQYTGLRPGEKLYEELLIDQENVEKTEHERILTSYEASYDFSEISKVFNELMKQSESENNRDAVFNILRTYVEGYAGGN